jgi:hypothetical protein
VSFDAKTPKPRTRADAASPSLSSFHYLIKKPIRVPYMEENVHKQFRTHSAQLFLSSLPTFAWTR